VLVGRQLAQALLAGFIALGLGANMLLLPALLPAPAFCFWPLCYWGGGGVILLGGLIIDLTFVAMIARLIRMHSTRCHAD
jgi:hypothetical protein